jgi:aldose sugar dehydrogenase
MKQTFYSMTLSLVFAGVMTFLVAGACGRGETLPQNPSSGFVSAVENGEDHLQGEDCLLIEEGFGESGEVDFRIEVVADGLDVPWSLAFLPNGDLLITERAGRVRLLQNGELRSDPVLEIPARDEGEGGLLGLVLHPDFESNRYLYLYYTADKNGDAVNRVVRYEMEEDFLSANEDKIMIDNIPSAVFHDGGRMRFGPDGYLYIGTGDAREPTLSQDLDSLSGKILRITDEGEVPRDNPFGEDNEVFLLGIRNTQGFDWLNENTLIVSDHGPSGELGRRGGDKVNVATAGANLGWPNIWRCEDDDDVAQAIIAWVDAVPPGGAALYTGDAISEWQGSFIMGTLRSEHLHRVILEREEGVVRVLGSEVYLLGEGGYGRLREVIMGPDGDLYVTTSNCDGRGVCPDEGDQILRVTR